MSQTDFSSLFELLPIGAYRSSPDGAQLRANPALVRLNGYESEQEMLKNVKDITESQRALLTLAASEQRFRALTEKASVMTMVCDVQGTILYASEAARDLLGRPADVLRGQNVFDTLHPQDRQQARDEMHRVVRRHGPAAETVLRYLHDDGQSRHLSSLATNFLDEDSIQGVVLDFRDGP